MQARTDLARCTRCGAEHRLAARKTGCPECGHEAWVLAQFPRASVDDSPARAAGTASP